MRNQMEEILDVCLRKIEEGIPVDEALEEYSEYREELRELLTIARDIENAPLPLLREEAVASCLAKVRDSLQLQKKPVWRARLPRLQWPRLFYFPSPAWAKALASVVMAILISWGAVNLSADSLPGEPLYPIKLATEEVRCFLIIEPEGKAKLRLAYSEERVQELVKYLDQEGELNLQALKAMLDETALAADNISKLHKDRGMHYCVKLEHLCASQRDILAGFRTKVPSLQRQELDDAIRICHHRVEWMGKVRRNEVPMGERGPFGLNET